MNKDIEAGIIAHCNQLMAELRNGHSDDTMIQIINHYAQRLTMYASMIKDNK